MAFTERISAACGRKKAELVLKHAKIINVFTESIEDGDVAVECGVIVGIGEYDGVREIDVQGCYVTPGLIDGHIHLESSMASPEEFARMVVPHGTAAVITDPHEIANVAGAAGIQFMLDRSAHFPIHYYVQVPSCVPSTPFEHAGCEMHAQDLAPFADHPRIKGLGEMMNAFGVVHCDADILKKLDLFRSKVLDGHLPTAPQDMLQPYAAAGIQTDHESVTYADALTKLRAGMSVLVREGSGSKNLESILAGVIQDGINTSHLAFCTDDKHLLDIHQEGTIRHQIQMAIAMGLSPMAAYQMATINAAQIYHLDDLGAVAPGRRADLVILDDLEQVTVHDVYFGGTPLAQLDLHPQAAPIPESICRSVRLPALSTASFQLPQQPDYPVIHMVPNQIITKKSTVTAEQMQQGLKNGTLLKVAVIERHHATGFVGVGLLADYGLRSGAIATTVAHDSHNLIVVGDNDADMLLAAQELQRVQGGYTLVQNGKVLSTLPLPIAGLMSDLGWQPLTDKIEELSHLAWNMGVNASMDPFIALSFLALPVIPEIRITDLGVREVQ